MKRLFYTEPELQPVEFRVERGFAASTTEYDSWHDGDNGSDDFGNVSYDDDDEFA